MPVTAPMKVLTLWQPWATLIAIGVKSIETRSWRAPASLVGERIAIHAAAKKPGRPGDCVGDWSVTRDPDTWGLTWNPYSPALAVARGDTAPVDWAPLPLGAIVAVATLADCVPILEGEPSPRDVGTKPDRHFAIDRGGVLRLWNRSDLDEYHGWVGTGEQHDQLPYGDFTPGRWAWLLTDIEPVTETCPACRGTGWIDEQPTNPEGQLQRPCPRNCTGYNVTGCDPIPFKGGQGLSRTWTP